MGAAGERLGLRLFLEGLEVPVVGAQVQIGINAPATASIQIVPGDKVLEFKARTMVHLFYWDYTQDHATAPDPPDPDRVAEQFKVSVDEARDIIADNPDLFASDVDTELRGYKLLFSGEVIGVVMMKTPAGRQAILQCSDFSTYWDTTYQFFVSYSPGGNFLGTSAAVWAGSDSMFDDLTAGHVSVMNEYLRARPKTPGFEKVKGLMGGIISLLEAMGGVPKHTHGINDFFTIAELKNHILQQIVAEQNDDTAQRLFDDKAFSDWLSRGMSSLGQLTTFRDMMKLLFKYVYYEVVPNPAPMYVRAKQSKTKTRRVTSTTKVEMPVELRAKLQGQYSAAEDWRVNLYTDEPYDEDNYARTFKLNLQKIANAANMPKVYKTKIEKSYTYLDKIKSTANDSRHVSQVSQGITMGPYPSKTFQENRNYWRKVTDILLDVLGTDAKFTSTRTKIDRTAPELDRLHTQIFRPDCFFAAPPKCNVLFPDQYTQFQYQRSFLQETTRLRLHEEWEFGINEGLLETNVHFAPSMKAIQDLAKKQLNSGIRALLPWEIYSGILPKFETVHTVNYVAGQAERRRGIKGNIKGAATDYTQRVANFNYMKYRFAARSAEVSAKFNPNLVCGFPAVIIEKPFIIDPATAEKVRDQVASTNTGQFDDIGELVRFAGRTLGAPTQYLGMVAALAHSVQQDSASTSLTMTHARTHRITDDDFLNIFSEEISKELATNIVSTVLDVDDLIKKGDFRMLKFLMDATPQDLETQAQTLEDEQTIELDSDDSPAVESRPDGAPSLDDVAVLSQFGSLLAPVSTEKAVKVSVPSTRVQDSTRIPIRGRVKEDRLKGTRDVILVPDPGGSKNLIGATGPKKGKIVQIQCVTDQAVGIVGKDTAKRIGAGQRVKLSNSPVESFTRDEATGKLVLEGNVVSSGQVTYFWKKIIIHEEVKTFKNVSKLLPVEEGLRPPWFSPLYSNWFIGDEIYEPFFGCGSIVDQSLFQTSSGSATFGTGRQQQQDILNRLKVAGNDRKTVLQILDEAKAKKITDVPDVESSVDSLAYIYGEIRRLGLDVHRFVHDYTRRPIATMEDIFGSSDLKYRLEGDKLVLESGTPGFHSTAIADVGGQLRGLLDDPDLERSRLKQGAGKRAPVSRDLDPRPGRRAKVLEYLEEINAASGSLGVGVSG